MSDDGRTTFDKRKVLTGMGRQVAYLGARRLEARSGPSVDPGVGEVCVDVAYTGICGTDLHIFHGDMDARVTAPAVIGHEMSGTISATGPEVDGWAIGAPVTVMPLAWCQTCPACVAGTRHLCHRMNFMGIDSPGSLQQSWIVPAGTLVRLPPDLPLRDAALIEPVAVAVHDVGRAGVRPGEQVLVVGGGPVGVLIALVARQAGADVVLAEIDEFRRNLAGDLGLPTLDPAAVDVAGWVTEWTQAKGAAVAFEVSGAQAGVTTAVASLSARGRLCLVAIHPEQRLLDLHRFFLRELELVGARLYDRADFVTAVDLTTRGLIPAEAMISQVVGLTDAAEAFHALESGAGVMKILVDCRN